jgi:hypothetical protein
MFEPCLRSSLPALPRRHSGMKRAVRLHHRHRGCWCGCWVCVDSAVRSLWDSFLETCCRSHITQMIQSIAIAERHSRRPYAPWSLETDKRRSGITVSRKRLINVKVKVKVNFICFNHITWWRILFAHARQSQSRSQFYLLQSHNMVKNAFCSCT